jgi:hypothetical protein
VSKPSAGHNEAEQVATPARYNELVAAFAGAACWLVLLVTTGPLFALQTLWVLLIALGIGAWTLLRRLRFSRSSLRITLGPWSRAVDLTQLASIRWKDNNVGVGAAGTLYLRDRSGHRVPIEVGRFKRGTEWAPLLLEAAAACGATVDGSARKILERGSHTAPSPGPEKGFTWKHLWGFPGFGFLAVLSIVALPVALALIAKAQTDAKPYQTAPICSAQTVRSCREIRQAVITDRGDGRHPDGSPGGDTWLRLQFSDGSQVYVDLPAYPQQVTFQPGQIVSAELWQGNVTLVSAAGVAQPSDVNPTSGARDVVWSLAIPLLFLFLSAICMSCVAVTMWRQRRHGASVLSTS